MGRITDLLDAIDVTKENTDELYSIFRSVPDFELPILRFYLSAGTTLIRQRVNLPAKDFFKISDLGYPPPYCLPGYERANLPFQPMFYACSFPGNSTEEKGTPPRVIALMETSSFFKDKQARGIERCTVSRWDLTKELELVAMPFTADYSMACPLINEIKEGWHKEIGRYEVNPDGKELILYMAEEIGKSFSNNFDYFKIANFVNYLLNYNKKTQTVDGIIYPSVPAEGAGFNIAIKPKASDKKVKFVGASLCHLLKKGERSHLSVMNHSTKVVNGTIVYEDVTFLPQEQAVYDRYAEGLSFIN